MNQYFLKALVNYLFQQYGTAISDFCFVFPGRRAGIFFRNYLIDYTEQPIWSPKILTINEFIEEFSTTLPADPITLLFKLYDVYKSTDQSDLTFDEFISWGDMLLSDFEDVDKYMVDPEKLYKNLISYKELDTDYSFLTEEQIKAIRSFWNSFNPNKHSEHQDSFIRKWEQILPLYKKFNQLLKNENLSYSGMIIRNIADKIKNGEGPTVSYPKIVFCGFFVLTPAEKIIFNYFKNIGIGEFYWDYPEHLITNHLNFNSFSPDSIPFKDAGDFMKENLLLFPPPTSWHLPKPNNDPGTEIIGVASQTEQLRIVTKFLEEGSSEKSNEKKSSLETAVILTDENMLIPVMHAIPPAYDKINVTIGYPLKNTPIFSLIESIINLQRHSKTTSQGKTWFYFRDVLPILQHQYISVLENESASSVKQEMLATNSIFIEASKLWKNDYFKLLFSKIARSEEIPSYIGSILYQTYQLVKANEQTHFEQEYVYVLYKSVNRLSELLNKLGEIKNPETWLRLFKKITETQTIPFKGEPLNGLQVMGILETRALDFDNLIILNMNEGVYPKDSAPTSMIPFNLRKGFGLPTLEHQDAIFSYYFFRLIHRAKKVTLVFNSSSDDMQPGEMSRFLYQLIYEHPVKPKLTTAVDQVKLYQTPKVYTSKTSEIINRLNRYAKDGDKSLSPSALSTYIECPQRFAYRYIFGLDEAEEITEDLDARIFGIIFHSSMEELYKPWLNKTVEAQEFETLSKNSEKIRQTLLQAFNKHFSEISLNTDDFDELQGKNILVFEVLFKYIQKFIENDALYAPIYFEGLEYKVAESLEIRKNLNVNIGGIIDRLDQIKGIIRVMDYKTGGGNNRINNISDLFLTNKHKDNKAIFQTLLYSSILKSIKGNTIPVQPSVVWLKTLFKNGEYTLKIGQRNQIREIILNDVEDEFIGKLKELLEEIFNPEIPFRQTPELKNCEYCTFKNLCNKN